MSMFGTLVNLIIYIVYLIWRLNILTERELQSTMVQLIRSIGYEKYSQQKNSAKGRH